MTNKRISQLSAASALNTTDTLALVQSGQTVKATIQQIKDAVGGGAKNMLINGEFRVSQRGVNFNPGTSPATNDDTYLIDRWLYLDESDATCNIHQDTTNQPDGSSHCLRASVNTENLKFGILQIVEYRNCLRSLDGEVSLSFKAKVDAGNANLDSIKVAILSWDGSPDNVTRDAVQTWNSANIDPIFEANWTVENTPTPITLNSTYQTISVENVTISAANAANLAVFIWHDERNTSSGDQIMIADVQLEPGASATDFVSAPIDQELLACKRYFQRLYTAGRGPYSDPSLVVTDPQVLIGGIHLPIELRTTPTGQVNTAGDFAVLNHNGALTSVSSITLNNPTPNGIDLEIETSLPTLNPGDASLLQMYGSDGSIDINAEL